MSDSQTFWVYVLLSQRTGLHYIGSTGDLDDRLIRHNAGRSKTTKADLPRTLVYGEKFDSRAAAYRRELEIKSWKSRRLIDQLVVIEHSDLSEGRPDKSGSSAPTSNFFPKMGATGWNPVARLAGRGVRQPSETVSAKRASADRLLQNPYKPMCVNWPC